MLLAGFLPVLAFPAPNLEFLAWFGLVPGLALIVRSPGSREAGIRAWWFGAGYLIFGLYWLAPEVGPGLLLIGAVFGLLWVPFGVFARRLLRPPVSWPRAAAALLVVPSCWLLTEWLRSWQALGGPWAVYGASQWQHPAVLALAAVGGVWLISFALVLANVSIVLVLAAVRPGVLLPPAPRKPGAGPRHRLSPWLAGAGVVAIIASGGAGPLAYALTPAFSAVRHETISLVQPGVMKNATAQSDATEVLTSSRSGPGELNGARPDLVIWGESSDSGHDLQKDTGLLHQFERLSGKIGSQVLVNQDAVIPGKGKEKVAVLIGPSGMLGTYVKTRLVPFGEYIPFRQQLGWLTRISRAASANMIPGNGAHVLHARDRAGRPLPIGVLICFESAFPDMSRVETDQGAQLIVYQSATTTFQGTWGPDQHASLAAVRAAETGRPVVQASLTGDTVAFDARGRLLAWVGQSQHGIITVRVGLPAQSARTPYDHLGDYVPWASTAVVVLASLVMLARSRGFLGGTAGAPGGREAQYESVSG